MTRAEAFLTGTVPSEPTIEKASRIVGETMVEASGRRKSTEYKQPVVSVLVHRAIRRALGEREGDGKQ
jgi:hypothetical protein